MKCRTLKSRNLMPFFIWWCKWCAKCYAHESFAHFCTLISLRTALRSSSVKYVAGLLCKHCTPDLRQRCAQNKLRPTLYNVAQLLALYCSLVWQYWAQRFSQCYTCKILHKRSALYLTYLCNKLFFIMLHKILCKIHNALRCTWRYTNCLSQCCAVFAKR